MNRIPLVPQRRNQGNEKSNGQVESRLPKHPQEQKRISDDDLVGIAGGQGRSGTDVRATAKWMTRIIEFAAVIIAFGVVYVSCFGK